jgi:hypothetical protein
MEKNERTVWTWDGIDYDQYNLDQTSLALDRQNLEHVSYYDWGNQKLKFAARNSSGGWNSFMAHQLLRCHQP